MMAMLFSVAIFAFENEQLANYKAKIADFFLFLSFILLLCVHKEVERNAPALHAGPHAFYPQGVQCASPQKAWQKRLYHMVASRCKNHFSLLANGYRDLNKVIEQLVNLKRTLRILANEWLVQWFQGFKNIQLFARQIVPRRNLIVPHEMSVKIRRERRLLIA